MKAVVLLSGGLDSAVCAALAVNEHAGVNVHAVSFRYGQKHTKELEAAQDIYLALGLSEHHIIDVPDVFSGAGSTLIDKDTEMPEMTYEELSKALGVSPTYVPFRNGTFLSLATAFALTAKANLLYYGAHAEDSRNWAYPDCTPEFNGSMAAAIYVGTYHEVRLVTPLQWMMKKDIVRLGLDLDVPFHLTWSCYNGRGRACGKCPTCTERIHAFQENCLTDPIPYEIDIAW